MSSGGKTVGTFEAKTKLAQILKLVENGERITITRRGVPIAEIIPAARRHSKAALLDTLAAINEFRKGRRVSRAELRQMIAEGRRF